MSDRERLIAVVSQALAGNHFFIVNGTYRGKQVGERLTISADASLHLAEVVVDALDFEGLVDDPECPYDRHLGLNLI